MPTPFETHIKNLRAALSELKPTGENGFEGLLAVALEAITGILFRLANSGLLSTYLKIDRQPQRLPCGDLPIHQPRIQKPA